MLHISPLGLGGLEVDPGSGLALSEVDDDTQETKAIQNDQEGDNPDFSWVPDLRSFNGGIVKRVGFSILRKQTPHNKL